LHWVEFNWLSPIFEDLTELSIEGEGIFDAGYNPFLYCLDRMPALELLDLRDTYPPSTERSPSLEPRNLVLSSLRTFIFSGDLEHCSFILKNLVLQHVQKLDISVRFMVTNSNRQCSLLSKILSFIAEHCGGHDAKLDVRRMTPVTPPPWETSGDGVHSFVHSFSYSHDNVQFKALFRGPRGSQLPFLEAARATLPLKDIIYTDQAIDELDVRFFDIHDAVASGLHTRVSYLL
jgi:hypothetical protein